MPSGDLPQEIITEILLRLPVKPLLRFRCVSKSWLSLISSTQFAKTHFKISADNRLVSSANNLPTVVYKCSATVTPHLREIKSVDFVPFTHPSRTNDILHIIGTCNGLVCVSLYSNTLMLWNPAIRKFRELPVSGTPFNFDIKYGFGYGEPNDDYKIVECCVILESGVSETQVKIYSSRSDSWRKARWPGGKVFGRSGVFLNGAIHWMVYYDLGNWAIVAQNITTEDFTVLDHPTPERNDARVSIGVSGLHLWLSYDCLDYVDVWMLKEYGVKESWTKLIRIFHDSHPWDIYPLEPKTLLVSENGLILLQIDPGCIVHVDSNSYEVHSFESNFEADIYNQSLISPSFDRVAGI